MNYNDIFSAFCIVDEIFSLEVWETRYAQEKLRAF